MIIPNLPKEKLITESGHMHPVWQKMFSQLLTVLNQGVSNEGYVIPAQGGPNFNTLNNSKNTQRFLFNSDHSAMMMNNGTNFETVVGATGAKTGIPVQTTVGAAGGASAPPLTPEKYWNINVNGTQYAMPLYKQS